MFEVKRLTPMDYIKNGVTDIPNDFYVFINDLQSGKLDLADTDEAKLKENFALFERFLKVTIECGVVSPPMLYKWEKDKEETHLLYVELTKEEQTQLLTAITGHATVGV